MSSPSHPAVAHDAPPSRRQALTFGGMAALGLVGGGGVALWAATHSGDSGPAPASGGRFVEPALLRSSGGRLSTTLRAAPGATVAGRRTEAWAFNGTVPGPTLVARPGDTLAITLDNQLPAMTNLHTHGLHVSPAGTSDNPFRTVAAGTQAAYEIVLPVNHPTGTYWYHPHHHGLVADQVFAGLYGAILVVGDDELTVDRERVLVVSDITLTADGQVPAVSHMAVMQGREGETVLVNGVVQPVLGADSGALERWRLVNACTSRFLDVSLDGHVFGLLGRDGQQLGAARDVPHLLVPPGGRADLLVRMADAGTYAVRTASVDRIRSSGMGMGMGMDGSTLSREAVLASVEVGSAAASTVAPTGSGAAASGWPTWSRDVRDLRGTAVRTQRRLVFTMGMGGGMFEIDGQVFDPARVDQSVMLGSVEEWTIANTSSMDHPFHLHVWPFQVLSAADHDPAGPPDWRDVVNVPSNGAVTVRIAFEDFSGASVYHCHVLDHEDQGMMGVVEVR